MASTFKNLSPDDKISTKTLLHEAIPITGTIVSGTYSDNNIKNFSHGMFQSVYDYPYLSSSANHIFDISTGFANSSALSSSTSTAGAQRAKKINIYNQMAQVLVGYDKTGSIQLFDEDGDIAAGGTKLTECIFMSFSRLLVKDEIKKGTFNLELGVNSDYSDPFSKRIKIIDESASDNYKINSPVGEYGILVADTSQNGVEHLTDDDGTLADGVKCGLIFYQAGVIALSSSVFDTSAAVAATATITAATPGSLLNAATFTLTNAAGTTTTYKINGGPPYHTQPGGAAGGTIDVLIGGAGSVAHIAEAVRKAINATTSGNMTATDDGTNVTVTQGTTGVAGNTISVDNSTGLASVGSFTGGGDGNGILKTTLGAPDMISGATFGSFKSLLTGSSISGSADALRHRIYNLSFNNTVELNSSIYFCRINHNEYNYSANPTYLSNSQIRVKQNSTDNPVSYVTTVGLYSADNQLLAVGKLSEPLRKDPTIEYTLRARLDY